MKRLVCFIIAFLPATGAFAQASLEATVFNLITNQPLVGVVVHLENQDIGYAEAKTSNAQGKVFFAGLTTAGVYETFVRQSTEYNEARAGDIRLRSNEKRSVVLLVGPVREVELDELVVEASGFAQLNTTSAEVASTLAAHEVEMLPIEGRDITRALFRLPNVTQATGFFPEAPNVSINGANALYVNYMIDGMDNNENFLGGQKFPIPVGSVQDVTVLTNNYSVEYGRTGNGVFNVTTKSGGNTVTGEAFYVTRPGPALDASSPYAQRDLSGNQVKDGFQRHQTGFAVGGPITRDETFFFVNLEQTYDIKDNLLNVPALGVNETVQGQNTFTLASARIDQIWSKRWRSTVRANLGVVGIERQGGGLEGGTEFPSTANTQDRNAALVGVQNTYLGDRIVYESNVLYSRFRWNYADPEDASSPRVDVLGANGLSLAGLGHPGYVFDDIENTIQLQQKLTLSTGQHTFKVGGEVITSNFELAGGGTPAGSYRVQLNESQEDALRTAALGSTLGIDDIPSDVQVLSYNVELRPIRFGARQTTYGVYLEDQIAVNSRLNLSVGLRYDFDTLSKGGADEGDLNNVAPRVNFNYLIDDRSVVRGGYGIFYDKVLYAVYSDALQQNSTAVGYRQQLQQLIDSGVLPADTDLDRVTFDGNVTVDATALTPGYLQGPGPFELAARRDEVFSNELRLLNPNGFDNPYTHQFSLGYQRQIASDKLFYVDLVHTRSYDLYRLRTLNPAAPWNPGPLGDLVFDPATYVRTPAEADATRPIAIVAGGARNILMSEAGGESKYYAASFNLLKDRRDDAYSYRFTYTLSNLRNNTEDINFRAQDGNDFDGEWGPSINDRTHVVSGIVYYYPAPRVAVSVAALVQSGQPINRIPDALIFGTTDLNGDGRSFADAYQGNSDRHPGESRNSGRLPWVSTFDLGAHYRLPIAGKTVEIRADIFNLFNAENLSGYSNNATQSNQIQLGGTNEIIRRNAAPPRQFQFGARVVF
ncbi:MAG: TonB-dependent receptor [Rhodothermales bacterium]|nr:TonB-dependent receptor [Rhodothermales bacterium]